MTSGSLSRDRSDSIRDVVAALVGRSGRSQRELVASAGLSKDQISRILNGGRAVSMSEALAILSAAGLPARGAITLALFDRADIVAEWSGLGLAAFLEGLVLALPDELEHAIGPRCDRVDPCWGRLMARLVAQRLAAHIGDLLDREERLGDARSIAMSKTS